MEQAIVVRGRLAERIREEARKLGLSAEEYVIELLSQGLDPKERAAEYIEAAEELLSEAREELKRGNVRQAAEKVWGAAALAIKAYAYLRDGKRLTTHGELWAYKRVIEDELGEWVHDAWMNATGMHVCFYEGWCVGRDVESALKRVERLVREVAKLVRAGAGVA